MPSSNCLNLGQPELPLPSIYALGGGEPSVLACDFPSRRGLVRDAGTPANNANGDVGGIMPVARAGGGGSWEDGVYTWVGNDVPRYGLDGELLVEPQRTRLNPYAKNFTSSWAKFRCSYVAGAALAPDGTLSEGYTAQTAGQTTMGLLGLTLSSMPGAVQFGMQITGRKKEKSFLVLGGDGPNILGANTYAYFDLENGVIGTVPAGFSASIEELPGDRWKCGVKFTSRAAGGNIQMVFGGADADGSLTVTDSGGIYVWGAQVEMGGGISSLILGTDGSQVTRSADTPAKALSAFNFGAANTVLVTGKAPGAIPQYMGLSNVKLALIETAAALSSLVGATPLNDDFSSYADTAAMLAAWSNSAGTNWTLSSGKALHATGSTVGLGKAITLVGNALYRVVFTVSGRTAGTIQPRFSGGGSVDGASGSTDGVYIRYMLANVGTTSLNFLPSSTFDGSIDDIRVDLVATDSSAALNHPLVVGTVGREVVASGAQLAALRAGSASGLIEDSAMLKAVGTGDFMFIGWLRGDNAGSAQYVMQAANTGGGDLLYLQRATSSGTAMLLARIPGGSDLTGATGFKDSVYRMVAFGRSGGQSVLAVNAVIEASAANSNNNLNSISMKDIYSVLGINLDIGGGSSFVNGAASLFRFVPGTVTLAQLQTIYDSEREYFEPNAAFTPPVITATDYYLPATQTLFEVAGVAGERWRGERDPNGRVKVRVDDGNVEQAELDLGPLVNGEDFSIAASLADNLLRACLNGGTPQEDTSLTLPTMTTLRLGCSANGEQWGGGIGSLKAIPRLMSGAEQQLETAP